jgi:hypothetical protein
MTSVDDLVTWLRTQLDEDQLDATSQKRLEAQFAPSNARATASIYIPPLALIGGAGNPDRVLVEVDAKRRMLSAIERLDQSANIDAGAAASELARLLALPYADREGYRDEWRP